MTFKIYSKKKGRYKTQHGGILVLTAAGSLLFIGLLALVLDISWMYYHKNHLESSLEAAWRAGYDEMMLLWFNNGRPPNDEEKDRIKQRVLDVLKANDQTDEDCASLQIVFPNEQDFPGLFEIWMEKKLKLFFARGLSIPVGTVSVKKSTNREDIVSNSNKFQTFESFLFPVGIPHGEVIANENTILTEISFTATETFVPGKRYLLRLGSGDIEIQKDGKSFPILHHGSLDLFEKENLDLYKRTVLLGWLKPAKLGKKVSLLKHNADLITHEAFQERLKRGAWGRLLIVPIIKFSNSQTNESFYAKDPDKTVGVICGFAKFIADMPSDPSIIASESIGRIYGIFDSYVVKPEF